MRFYEKLRRLRLDRGLSFRKAELLSGVSYASMSTLERGASENAKVKNVVKLARFYGVSLDWLFEDDFK